MRTGRPPKSPGTAQGHRNRAKRTTSSGAELTVVAPAEVLEGEVLAPVPAPPLTVRGLPLQDEALLMWDRYWLSKLVQALDDRDGVDRIIVEEWIRLENELLIVDFEVQGERLVFGSKGQPRPSPLLIERTTLANRLKESRLQLGIGPRNRAALGIELAGAVTAVDRMNRQLNATAAGQEYEPDQDWDELTVPQLRAEARLAGVPGAISRMRRDDLLDALEAAGE